MCPETLLSRRAVLASLSLGPLGLFEGCAPTVPIVAAEGGLFVGSLIGLGAEATKGIAFGVLGNCAYDVIGKKNCALFSPASVSEDHGSGSPRQVDVSLSDVEEYARANNYDIALCSKTARAFGPSGPRLVMACLKNQGSIWYQKNETGSDDVNKAKVLVRNLTDDYLSPRISVTLHDAESGAREIELIKDVAPTIDPRQTFHQSIFVAPSILLRPGMKYVSMTALFSKKIDTSDLIITKRESVAICPGAIKYRT